MVTAVKRTLTLAGLIGTALLVAVLAACGNQSKNTSLKLVADNGFGSKAVFHLRCNPPGGDIARPAQACAALKEYPGALLHPRPFLCFMDYWKIAISGRFEGRRVKVKTDTCWTPQMELIDRLGIAKQLEAHFVSYGPRRGLRAKMVNIPPKTPAWLSAFAQAQAVVLGDSRPERILIELRRGEDIINIWGHFRCPKPCGLKFRGPARQTRVGTYARIKVDSKTRAVVYAWLMSR